MIQEEIVTYIDATEKKTRSSSISSLKSHFGEEMLRNELYKAITKH
jgi:hypothetical protein